MTQILIIGGAGFIGSNLCKELSKNNSLELTSLDNYFTGDVKNHHKNIRYINGHTKDIFDLINFKPSIIIHLGEYSRVEQSFRDRDIVFESNYFGTRQVIEFAVHNNSKLVYGASSTVFASESKNLSPYSFTKSTNVDLIKAYSKWYGINFSIVYFYNVYGGNEICHGQYATLIGIFTNQYINNENLTVVKPGSQMRNFTHINDVVSGLILVIKNIKNNEFHLGNDKKYSVLDIAKMFNRNIIFLPEREGNRSDSNIDNSDLRKLGWKPSVEIIDYINKIKLL